MAALEMEREILKELNQNLVEIKTLAGNNLEDL